MALYSQREAARITGVSRMTLWRWIKSGRLEKHKYGLVDTEDIDFLRSVAIRGRPAGRKKEPEHKSPYQRALASDLDLGLKIIEGSLSQLDEAYRAHFTKQAMAALKAKYEALLDTL